MRLDDETLLTAYLDGELDAADRHRVQSAVADSPVLARRLRDLAEARDFVEGLSRPAAPADLSIAILARIAEPSHPWAIRVGSARVISPRWLAVASCLAAACLLFVSSLSRPPELAPGGLAKLDPPTPLKAPGPVIAAAALPVPPIVSSGQPINPPRHASVVSPRPIVVAAISPSEAESEADRVRQQARVQALLERPDVRKITLNVDVIDARSLSEVRRSIDELPRKTPLNAQITVTQGVLIDPRAPEGAVVFLVVLDNDEQRELFYSNLHDRVGGSISAEKSAPPEEVVQLADLGQVRAYDGPSIPHLSPPPSNIRAGDRVAIRGDSTSATLDPPGFSLPDELSIPSRMARTPSGPVATPSRRHRPSGGRHSDSSSSPIAHAAAEPRDRSPESAVVLVWLVPKGSRGSSQ